MAFEEVGDAVGIDVIDEVCEQGTGAREIVFDAIAEHFEDRNRQIFRKIDAGNVVEFGEHFFIDDVGSDFVVRGNALVDSRQPRLEIGLHRGEIDRHGAVIDDDVLLQVMFDARGQDIAVILLIIDGDEVEGGEFFGGTRPNSFACIGSGDGGTVFADDVGRRGGAVGERDRDAFARLQAVDLPDDAPTVGSLGGDDVKRRVGSDRVIVDDGSPREACQSCAAVEHIAIGTCGGDRLIVIDGGNALIVDDELGTDGIGNVVEEQSPRVVRDSQAVVAEVDLDIELVELDRIDIERIDIGLEADDGRRAERIEFEHLPRTVACKGNDIRPAVAVDGGGVIDVNEIALIRARDGIARRLREHPSVDAGIGGIDDIADGIAEAVQRREENAEFGGFIAVENDVDNAVAAAVRADFIDEILPDSVDIGGEHFTGKLVGELIGEQRLGEFEPTTQDEVVVFIDHIDEAAPELLQTVFFLQGHKNLCVNPFIEPDAA